MISGFESGLDNMITPSEEDLMVTEGKKFQCDTFEKIYNILNQ